MAETAAHLVDHVIPRVPVRQWVLSFPIPLRILLAAHPELLSALLQIIHRVIASFLINNRESNAARLTAARSRLSSASVPPPSSTSICIAWCSMACIAAALACQFHAARATSNDELQTLLNRIIQRILKRLTRTGQLIEEHGMRYLAETDASSALTRLQAAACTYRIAAQGHTRGKKY